MSNFNPDDQIRVVAVCGTQARVYETLDLDQSRRQLVMTREFNTRGAAALWAQEYEAAERASMLRRTR